MAPSSGELMQRQVGRALRALAGVALAFACAGPLLAQDPPPPPPPPPAGELPLPDRIKEDLVALWHMPAGKAIAGLIVLITLVRIFFAIKESAKRAARQGGEGFLGRYYAGKELEQLLKGGRFDQAGE